MTEELTQQAPQIMETSVVESLTRGEVDMQVTTAKKYPRSIDAFQKKAMTLAASDRVTAAGCFYVLPRAGTKIEGPGVRLAEIVASSYGNLRCETRVVNVGQKTITAQATAWDMENNVLIRCETSRRITNKEGKRYSDDMIVMTGNAAASIAFRNAIWKVVPFSYVRQIYEKCKLVARGDKVGVDQSKKDWIAYYGKMEISEDQVLELIGRSSLTDVDLEDITTLQGLATALDEGRTTLDEVFGVKPMKEGTTGFGFKGKRAAAKKAAGKSSAKKDPPKKKGSSPPPADDEPPPPDDSDKVF